ncbi:MAG TPA: exodeoxyribonuclease VII large subunit [Acidimicrobiales bacterium]
MQAHQEPLFDEEPTMSVAELNAGIGAVLSRAFPDEVWVRGEIANINRPPSGHVYFDLVGDDCSLGVTLWASDRQVVNGVLRRSGGAVRMTDGTEVRIRVRVSWYAERGRVSLRMLSIDTSYTLGRLAEAREVLLRTLSSEGLLRRQATMSVAAVPLRIGLITSDGSAAAHDFLRTLEGSGHAWQVTVLDTRVQGTAAEKSILAALERAGNATPSFDAVCIVRGGGARTDLAAFDQEAVARAIALAPVAIWTGIGHEIDTTVADAVAHSQFRTPTACAMALVEQVTRWCEQLDGTWRAIARAASHHLRTRSSALDDCERRLRTQPARSLDRAQRLIDATEARVRALDPAQTLARGWSITHDADGRLVRSINDVTAGTALVTTVADGALRSVVDG